MRTRAPRGPVTDNPRAEDPAACREAALKLLDRTRRTRSDLTRRLRDKGYAAVTIALVLERLAEVGLVDDAEYARAFMAGRRARRSAGSRRIEQELRARGIGADDIAAARTRLDAEQGAMDEVAAARKVISQAARRTAALEPRIRRQRLWSLLARRGFDGDTIERALAEAKDEST